MGKLKRILFFGGIDKEVFDIIHSRVSEDNKKAVSYFSALTAICLLFTAVLAVTTDWQVPAGIYLVLTAVFVVVLILNFFLYKKNPQIGNIFAVLISVSMLAFGIYMAYTQSTERTTLILPIFILVALAFCYRPVYLIAILVLSEIAYLIAMSRVESGSLFITNVGNTVIFCFFGIVCGLFTLAIKYRKYKAEYESQVLLERDILTGLYNRFSCEKEFDKIIAEKIPVTLCSLDVNRLKQTNDTKGHTAGDELLCGAAECMRDVFGPYGKIFRIGGDEFCAVLYGDVDSEKLEKDFYARTKVWKGTLVDELAVACGRAVLDHDFEKAYEVFCEADIKMYAAKKAYYGGNYND